MGTAPLGHFPDCRPSGVKGKDAYAQKKPPKGACTPGTMKDRTIVKDLEEALGRCPYRKTWKKSVPMASTSRRSRKTHALVFWERRNTVRDPQQDETAGRVSKTERPRGGGNFPSTLKP